MPFKLHTGIPDVPFFAIPTSVDLCHSNTGDLKQLIATIRKTTNDQIVHITIDTVNRALAGGDENGSADMGAFVQSMDRLRDEFGAHIGAVHHTGKNPAQGARGHSLLKANLDTELEVTCIAGDRSVSVNKQRDGVTGAIVHFELKSIFLGVNSDGDPVHSCVVAPPPATQTQIQPTPRASLSAKQKIAFDTLKRALGARGTPAPTHNYIPPNVAVSTSTCGGALL